MEAGHFNSFALKGDGTVWGWGLDPISFGSNDSLTPQQIDSDTNWVAISSSDYCLLALKSDGTLWVRGQNAQATAQDYVTTSASAFIQIGGDKDWATVYAGQGYLFARKRDGSWWVCGNNNYGQLGIGSTGSVHSPQRLPFQFEPWAFSPGLGTAVLLGQDGTLWTWGKRLGTAPHNGRVRTFINRILDVLPSQLGLKTGNLIIDPKPYPLWQFPADIRRSLIDDAGKE
jgi:alpha-tubulin suppressor-like RCC1 family protein